MPHPNPHSTSPPNFKDANSFGALEQELERKTQQLADAHRDVEAIRNEFQQFASSISHDLGAPLRAIDGFSKLLCASFDDESDSKSQLYLQYIEHGASRVRKLLRGMLDFSGVMSKASTFEPIDLNETLNLALAKLIPQVVTSKAEVSSDQLPTIVADQYQVTQLFLCLIENAIRFQRDEPPKIHVSASENSDDWTITIKDNGMGISPKHHESIFKMFRVLEAKESALGAGVGLPICRQIVDRHRGRIWLDSQENLGSTFHFSISRILHSQTSETKTLNAQ